MCDMAQRTYVPTLRVLTWALKKFVNKYQVKIEHNLDSTTYEVLLQLLALADQLLILLGEPPIED